MTAAYRFLRFGPDATAKEDCKKCGAPATGIAMICGWWPMYACDACEVEIRRADAAAIADEKHKAFAAQEFIA